MSTRKIASSTLWQLASQITMAGLSILTVKFVAMGLSKELAGNYNSAYGYLQLFGILADFGLYAVAVREVSSSRDRERVLGALIILRTLILCLSLGTALLIVWLLPAWRGTPLPLSVTIASLVPFFTLLAGILRTIFQVEYQMHFVFIAEVVQRVITTALIGFFILQGIRGSTDLQILHLFLFTGGIGAFVLFLLSFTYGDRLMSVHLTWDTVLLRQLFRKALPYGIAFLCVALYRQFDVSLIALLRQDFEIQNAYYGFVQRMMDMAYLLPTFLLNSMLPTLSERDARGEDTRDFLGKILLAILILGSIATLFSSLWARPLMQMLTTERYLSTTISPGSDTALEFLSISMFCNGLLTFSFYILLTRNRWKPLVVTLLIGVVLSLICNVLLIPRWGFVGASVTSVIVHLILTSLLLPQSLSVLPARLTVRQGLQWASFSGLLAIFLLLTRGSLSHPLTTAGMLLVATAWMGICGFITGLHRTLRA